MGESSGISQAFDFIVPRRILESIPAEARGQRRKLGQVGIQSRIRYSFPVGLRPAGEFSTISHEGVPGVAVQQEHLPSSSYW